MNPESLEQSNSGVENNESEPKYDAILVLGACMEWDKNKKQWIFPTWVPKEIYNPELVMGKARAIAASELREGAEVMLVTGGPQLNPETGETASRAIELSKLIAEYDVPNEKIIPIGKGGNTLENAKDTATYLESHPEIVVNKKIAVLSPRFQYERARMMFEQHPYFIDHNISVDWIIVEDILENRSGKYKKWTEALQNDHRYSEVLKSEENGINDIKSGNYKSKQ